MHLHATSCAIEMSSLIAYGNSLQHQAENTWKMYVKTDMLESTIFSETNHHVNVIHTLAPLVYAQALTATPGVSNEQNKQSQFHRLSIVHVALSSKLLHIRICVKITKSACVHHWWKPVRHQLYYSRPWWTAFITFGDEAKSQSFARIPTIDCHDCNIECTAFYLWTKDINTIKSEAIHGDIKPSISDAERPHCR